MSEDKFEEFLKKAAQSYNAPPVRTPREEMWTAIQAKRSAGPRVVYGGGTIVPIERRFGSRVWWGAAAAALMLVATGVGIGRWSASSPANSLEVASRPAVKPTTSTPGAENPSSAVVPENKSSAPELVARNQPASGARSVSPDAGSASAGSSRSTTHKAGTISRSTEVTQVASGSCAVIRGCAPVVSRAVPEATDSRRGSSAYQLATVQHLSDAEALLTSYRSRTSADRQMDAQLAKWARDLLTNTRLLLDSPVANDPQRRPLLEDLELVLVQIVQLSPGSTAQDHDMIEKTLQQEHVLTRLRTAIPAGAQRGS